ncbi:MAG: energy-coupling factor transporter transmembrane component T family protein [Actinomycetota bacterium]
MLPVYRPRETILHGLHPLAALILYASLVAVVLLLQNPIYLVICGAGILSLVLLAEAGRECRPFLALGLFMALLAALFNPLVNRQGGHVLVYGPKLPALGRLDITLEAVTYGAVSGFRILLVIALFGLASVTVNPDDLLEMLSRISLRSSLSAALAVRLYPSLVVEAREMIDVQLARGERLRGGGRWERLRAHFPFWLALFRGSLDRAANIAEAMSARGFGSGKITRRRRPLRGRDLILMPFSLTAVAAAAFSAAGRGSYRYFPFLDNPLEGIQLSILVFLAVFFVAIFVIGRCWKKWPWWRSRI